MNELQELKAENEHQKRLLERHGIPWKPNSGPEETQPRESLESALENSLG